MPRDFTDETALSALAAISNPTRLAILRALVRAGPGGLPATAIADAVAATPSRASFHLATMAEAGLVTSERAARQITYRMDYETLGGLIRHLVEDCCGSHPTLCGCAGKACC
ncbi:MAG: metalloregulator ArsR/SmtB family transcription factor [Pseudomonadota bacterium]